MTTTGVDTKADALAAAALLERWADAVPIWDPTAGERWYIYADRRFEAEQELEAKLRRLPGCQLTRDARGTSVDLTLCGIRVRRENCLANACRSWAAKVRRRAEE